MFQISKAQNAFFVYMSSLKPSSDVDPLEKYSLLSRQGALLSFSLSLFFNLSLFCVRALLNLHDNGLFIDFSISLPRETTLKEICQRCISLVVLSMSSFSVSSFASAVLILFWSIVVSIGSDLSPTDWARHCFYQVCIPVGRVFNPWLYLFNVQV